jgi:hypothetical protein
MSKLRLSFLFLTWALLGTAAVLAQGQSSTIIPKSNSPLSRFGLGDPLDQFFAPAASMGGMQAAWQSPVHLNLLNPASLASLQTTSFEVGLFGKYTNLQDQQNGATVWSGNLQYLALGFPLRNAINRTLDRKTDDWNVGMSINLAPYTQVGYDLNLNEIVPEVDLTSNRLKGTGGVYRLQWGNGFRFRNLSVGASLNYHFGKLTNSRQVDFDSLNIALSSDFREEQSVRGFGWGVGAQYVYEFKKPNAAGEPEPTGKRIILGMNGTLQTNLDTDNSQVFVRTFPNFNFPVQDTIFNLSGLAGTLDLPSEWNFGVAYEDLNHFYIGFEYGFGNWAGYRNTAQQDQLTDTRRLALGVEYIPNDNSYNNYWQRVRYRAGLRLEDDPRQIGGEQAQRRALTLGLGLPILMPRRQESYVALAFELGQFGISDILEENYVKFTLGFSLNDNTWFFKRKFN